MTIEEKINLLLESKPKSRAFRPYGFFAFFAFFLIGAGVLTTFRLTGTPVNLSLLARGSSSPESIRIESIGANKFTVNWQTGAASTGYILYGTTNNQKDRIAYDDSATGDKKNFLTKKHKVTVSSLTPKQLYFYSIFSQGREYASSEGSIFTPIKTLPENFSSIESSTNSPAKSGFGKLLK